MSDTWKTYPQETLPGFDVSKDIVKMIEDAGFEVKPARASDGRLGLSFISKLAADSLRVLDALLAGSGVDFNGSWVFITK